MGSSISYFSLLQLSSLPSIAPYCNRCVSAQMYVLLPQHKKRNIWIEWGLAVHLKERVSAGRSRTISLFFTQTASSAYYYVVLTTESLRASQLLYPFYIPFLRQSALGQSRLPGTLLLHQGS